MFTPQAIGRLSRTAPFVHLDPDVAGKDVGSIAAFVGHLDQRTTQRYTHFMPKDKRETANSIPFEF